MSFILDALKKSEAERQRRDTPGISDVPHGRGGATGRNWMWVIGVLLAVNLAVLLGLILHRDAEPVGTADVASPIRTTAGATDAPAPAPAPQSFSDIVSEAKRSQPAPVSVSQQPVAPAATTTPAAQRDQPVSRVKEGLATFDELRSRGTLQLPDLHLDIHVYSSAPAERFVFINMSKYREHATLDEGPVVQEITTDGVILEYQGTRFLLPRE